MEITDVQIRKVLTESKLKAYATVTFDGCFVLHNVKLVEGEKGIFVAMPSRRTKAGAYKDIAHPITPDFRIEMQNKILSAYTAYMVANRTEVTPEEFCSSFSDCM